MPAATDITGLVLAGGRGSRMGGLDKGLQPWQGRPLVRHAVERLAPQVASVALNVNRSHEAYRDAFGGTLPLLGDDPPDFAGPLAGFLAGLRHATTGWLVTVPCDSPLLPNDLVARLSAAADAAGAPGALARTHGTEGPQTHPVFCLMRSSLRPSLEAFMAAGGRKIDRWTREQGLVEVDFPDERAFFNANTFDDLRALDAPVASGLPSP